MNLFSLIFLCLLALIPAATLVVNTGRAIATNLIGAIGGTAPKYVGWGTGAGTAGATDTTLFTEATEARTSCVASQVTTTTTNDTLQMVGTITVAGAGKTITNVALFDQLAVGGNMYVKSDFAGLALNIGDSIAWTIKITYS